METLERMGYVHSFFKKEKTGRPSKYYGMTLVGFSNDISVTDEREAKIRQLSNFVSTLNKLGYYARRF